MSEESNLTSLYLSTQLLDLCLEISLILRRIGSMPSCPEKARQDFPQPQSGCPSQEEEQN